MDFSIRRLGPGDIALARGLNQCFLEVFADEANHEGIPPSDTYLEELLGTRGNIAIVALSDDEVIGSLTAYEFRKFESQRSEIYIYDLAVYAEYRRQGVATAMINEIREIARERAAWVVMIQADRGDVAPVTLYSKLGQREQVFHFDIDPAGHSE